MPSPFRCPKCGSVSDAAPDAQGVITCPSCSVRLRPRAPAASLVPSPAPAPAPLVPAPAAPVVPPVVAPPAPPVAAAPAPASAPAPAPPGPTLETLLREIRTVRALQEQILASMRAQGMAAPASMTEDDDQDDTPPPQPTPQPVRSRRRKTVLLIDDDPVSGNAAKSALETADVPVRMVDSGNAALSAIAAEKPDVIAIELEMGGAMGGKDVINMIKATMEWVDIPLVLYTRAPVASQKETRTIHGADEYVLKGAEAPKLLVSRVITLFRRA